MLLNFELEEGGTAAIRADAINSVYLSRKGPGACVFLQGGSHARVKESPEEVQRRVEQALTVDEWAICRLTIAVLGLTTVAAAVAVAALSGLPELYAKVLLTLLAVAFMTASAIYTTRPKR